MIPWKNGKPLVWDTTCPDTLVLSYCSQATSSAGAVADLAEGRKPDKYSSLGLGYFFASIAIIKTFGAMGNNTLSFLMELGHRVKRCTGEVKAKAFLLQRLSVQRGNTASVLGSVGSSRSVLIFNALSSFLYPFSCSLCLFLLFPLYLISCCLEFQLHISLYHLFIQTWNNISLYHLFIQTWNISLYHLFIQTWNNISLYHLFIQTWNNISLYHLFIQTWNNISCTTYLYKHGTINRAI